MLRMGHQPEQGFQRLIVLLISGRELTNRFDQRPKLRWSLPKLAGLPDSRGLVSSRGPMNGTASRR